MALLGCALQVNFQRVSIEEPGTTSRHSESGTDFAAWLPSPYWIEFLIAILGVALLQVATIWNFVCDRAFAFSS